MPSCNRQASRNASLARNFFESKVPVPTQKLELMMASKNHVLHPPDAEIADLILQLSGVQSRQQMPKMREKETKRAYRNVKTINSGAKLRCAMCKSRLSRRALELLEITAF